MQYDTNLRSLLNYTDLELHLMTALERIETVLFNLNEPTLSAREQIDKSKRVIADTFAAPVFKARSIPPKGNA